MTDNTQRTLEVVKIVSDRTDHHLASAAGKVPMDRQQINQLTVSSDMLHHAYLQR